MESTYARRLATAIPATTTTAVMKGRMSTPPPNGPSGLTAMLARPSTASVPSPYATAWRTLVWAATVYRAIIGATSTAPFT